MDDELVARRALAPLARSLGLPPGFAGLNATAKLKTLLDLPDPGRVIRRLRPDEAYGLVREIGLEASWELMALGTPEQRQAVRDLEVWTEDRYDPERFDQLLDLTVQAGFDHAIELVRDCDGEMLALHIFSQARVSLAREDEQNRDADGPEGDEEEASFLSPDGEFMIHCNSTANVPSVRRLLDLMYAQGVEFAHRILFAGMYDTVSSLEHQARHFREKRLEDLGFPPPDERTAIWEPFDVKGIKDLLEREVFHAAAKVDGLAMAEDRPPLALVFANEGSRSLLWETLVTVEDPKALQSLFHLLLYLVNKVVAALTTTYHDDEAWEAAASHTVGLVSLGLEDLSGGDRDRAREVLLAVHPQHLYRAGIEVLRALNLLAQKVLLDVGGMARLSIVGEERAEVIRAALVFPPERPVGSGAPLAWTMAEAKRTRRILKDTLTVLRFAREHLGLTMDSSKTSPHTIVEPTLANVLATAWARQILQGDPTPTPLSGEEVRDLLVSAFEGGRIRASLRTLTLSPSEDEAVRAFLDEALARVEDALGRLDPGQPVDVRFLGDCLLVQGVPSEG